MTVAEAIAYAKLNDHKLPREIVIQEALDRECMRVLWQEVERLQSVLTLYKGVIDQARGEP